MALGAGKHLNFCFMCPGSRICALTTSCVRICPGKAFGDANVWLAIVSIAAAFQISGQLSEKDRNLDYTTAFTTGFVS